jgi:class 3 adenylate cyclase
LRVGLYTGEIEILDDVAGIAVHIGARVAALGVAWDLLVSGAIPPLVVGSGIEFDDRGAHSLEGVPGDCRIYTVSV